MEITKPKMMPMCVKSLIKYINELKMDFGSFNIYLATDYPLINVGENKAQSSTFHIITNYHHDAIKLLNGTFNLNTWVSMKTLNYLFNEFPDYENEIIEELQGSGIQGIFDKLILTNSNYFISGPEGCAYVKSKFSRKIGEERRRLIEDRNINILNNITRWPLY